MRLELSTQRGNAQRINILKKSNPKASYFYRQNVYPLTFKASGGACQKVCQETILSCSGLSGVLGRLLGVDPVKVLKNLNLCEILEKEALKDGLTGLYKKNIFSNDLNRLFTKAQDGSLDGLAVGILDLDHFKSINDNLGHQTGDIVLKKVGSILNEMKNEEGEKQIIPARYGGEEFAILLTGFKPEEAKKKMTEIYSSVIKDLREDEIINQGFFKLKGNLSERVQTIEERKQTLKDLNQNYRNLQSKEGTRSNDELIAASKSAIGVFNIMLNQNHLDDLFKKEIESWLKKLSNDYTKIESGEFKAFLDAINKSNRFAIDDTKKWYEYFADKDGFTTSMGISIFDKEQHQNPNDLVKLADGSLYFAKRNRNTIIFADEISF